MNAFGLFCKSFRRDLGRFERLAASVEAHDCDGLPFVVSVPRADRALFARHRRGRVEVVCDEDVVGASIEQSWRAQQIVKLHAWKLGFSRAFLMLDSDFFFIRPFGIDDFFGPDGTPRFIVSRCCHRYDPDNADLLAALEGRPAPAPVTREECSALARSPLRFGTIGPVQRLLLRCWDGLTRPQAERTLPRIRAVIPRAGPDYHVMPGPIWTLEMHRRFARDYLEPRGLAYADLIAHAPWEYVWIAEWMLAQGLPNATPSEPLFLHFASDAAIRHAGARGLGPAVFAARYLGLAFAGGHAAQTAEKWIAG